MVHLISSRAVEMSLINRVTEAKEINVETTHNFSVNYADNNINCRATLQIGLIAQGNPDALTIACTVEGEFLTTEIKSDDDKKQVHVECYRSLFPYAQSLISRICLEGGMPPYYFPQMEMTTDNVIINK